MQLSQLPQSMIDAFFKYQNKPVNFVSEWNKKYELVQTSNVPYFRYIIKDDDFYYKIFWDNTSHPKIRKYRIIETFNHAVNRGFFDNIALVDRYIKLGNTIIGYVYPQCEKVTDKFKMKRTVNRMDELFFQPDEFKTLYRQIRNNIENTGIAYTDLYPTNIVQYDNKYYIIDLDSLVNLDKISVNTINERYGSLPLFYSKYLCHILYKK
jgi:hypothetical protein